jgi:membrane protease YdiL (CAAX protease family)
MEIPLQLITFSIPALITLIVLRRRGDPWKEALEKIGWQVSRPVHYLWSLGVIIFTGGLGWLVQRFGFRADNLVQALVFLLPHLLLITISLNLWPVVAVQFVAGWLLGWLRFRSDSILPGWLAHSLINAMGAFAAMG